MTLVVMTSTTGELTSGQTFRVRAKEAQNLVAQGKATLSPAKKITVANAQTKEGKRSQ